MYIKKRCQLCGQPYMTGNGKAKYCSDACKKEATRQRQAKWRAEHPDYHKNYHAEHPEAVERFKEKNPNYDRDRSRKIRGNQEYTRICPVCGKTFTTWRSGKFTCSDECRVKRDNQRQREDDRDGHERWIKQRYGSEEARAEHLARLEQERAEKKRQAEIQRQAEKQARAEEQQRLIDERRRRKQAEKEARRISGVCAVCGNTFLTFNPMQKTCSKKCGKGLAYAKKKHRIPKNQIVDKDITLEALYRRDSGVCYLCGGKCDWGDKNGMIVGPNYPSVDHVIPISHGGLHSWNNVRLAHFWCNSMKSDGTIEKAKEAINA